MKDRCKKTCNNWCFWCIVGFITYPIEHIVWARLWAFMQLPGVIG